MNAKTLKNSTKPMFSLCILAVMLLMTSAFGWRGGSGGGGEHGGGGGYHGGSGFHGHFGGGYHGGHGWYGYYGPSIVIGDPYYYYNPPYPVYAEEYVVEAPSVAVAATAPIAQPNAQQNGVTQMKPTTADATLSSVPTGSTDAIGDTVTVYVPNANGRFTPVNLIKAKNGYSGPQGEFYPNHPTIAQLRALYGN
jgi:hypothetical protein